MTGWQVRSNGTPRWPRVPLPPIAAPGMPTSHGKRDDRQSNGLNEEAMRILLVEDERRLASTLAKGIRAGGDVVLTAYNGTDGLWLGSEEQFDAIVLDIMLPGLSGYEVLRQLRARQVWTPVLMLTSKDGE